MTAYTISSIPNLVVIEIKITNRLFNPNYLTFCSGMNFPIAKGVAVKLAGVTLVLYPIPNINPSAGS
jgi:hypothetical protein